MKTTLHTLILLLLAVVVAWPNFATAQTTQPGAKQSDDLVHSAEFIRKKLDELLATMSDVARLLEKTDPEAARILRQTVIYAQQEDVVNKIDEVKRLLRQGLDQAAEASQSEVIGDLTHMLRLLEGVRGDLTETDERLAELRAVRNRLNALFKRQEAEEARTRAVMAKDQIDKDSKALLESLQNLIRRQKALLRETGKLPEPTEAVKKLSELHRAVRRLMRMQRLLNESVGKAAAPGAQALHELSSAEKILAEAIKALLAKTPAEELAKTQKRLTTETRALKDAAQAVAEKAGLDVTKLPAANLDKAGGYMNQAVEALEHQDRPPAQGQQTEAIKALQAELARAEELRRKALARAQAKLDAAEQNEITKQIDQTAESMKTGRNGKAMPGESSAAQAGESSGKAGQSLAQNDAAQANPRQNETKDHLRDAMKSLDEEIEKLERRGKAEKLASISERLEKVLERQKACTKQTRAVYDARAKADPPYDRAAQQKLAELAGVEGDLAAEVQSVRAMLKKEGTTVVFPAVLGDVKQDLTDVRTWLGRFDPGPLTRATQEEIQRTLEELLASVRKELSKGPGRGRSGGGGGGQCKPPLIPPIAELRMLRMKQLRVNRNTKRLAALAEAGKLPETQSQVEYKKLTRRQEQVLKLVREIRAKLQKENKSINPIPQPEDRP